MLHSDANGVWRGEFGSGGGFDGSVERQSVLLMHSDMQQSTSIVCGAARVTLLADAILPEHATQLEELCVRQTCNTPDQQRCHS